MVDAGKQALSLWALQLVPSLFPFMILSNLFLKLSYDMFDLSKKKHETFLFKITGLTYYGFYIFLLGQLCGYPLGAKMTATAYQDKKITKEEANYLMTICNQSSPSFLEYYVCSYALSDIISGVTLIFLFLTGTLLTSLCTRILYPVEFKYKADSIRNNTADKKKKKSNIFILLDQCISDSCLVILKIGGYIILFSILSDMLLHVDLFSKPIKTLIASTLELSNGLFLLKNLFSNAAYYPYFIIGLTAFGGFCTMAQIKGMLVGTSLSIKPYLIGKIIYVAITLTLTVFLFQIQII